MIDKEFSLIFEDRENSLCFMGIRNLLLVKPLAQAEFALNTCKNSSNLHCFMEQSIYVFTPYLSSQRAMKRGPSPFGSLSIIFSLR